MHTQLSLSGSILRKPLIALSLAVASLTGCASITSVPTGTPVADILQQFGKPITVCEHPDGSKRLVWTSQPSGQFAWGANISKAGTLEGTVQQILTDAHFNVLSESKWTQQQVLCEFGPPANVEGVAKDSEIVWAYRYKQSSVWPSMMYVYFDSKGTQVTHFHPGPDPWSLGDGNRTR
jgi:hypothetical protein